MVIGSASASSPGVAEHAQVQFLAGASQVLARRHWATRTPVESRGLTVCRRRPVPRLLGGGPVRRRLLVGESQLSKSETRFLTLSWLAPPQGTIQTQLPSGRRLVLAARLCGQGCTDSGQLEGLSVWWEDTQASAMCWRGSTWLNKKCVHVSVLCRSYV